jgi:hypothetical protein
MKVHAGFLAVLAIAALVPGAGHAQSDPRPPAGSETAGSPEVQPEPRSGAGSATENAGDHQPAVKPGVGDPVRENIWESPLDTRITVNQGRASNKKPRGMGVAVRAISLRLQNKSRLAMVPMVPGVAVHHDAYHQRQKPTRMFFRASVSFPARNAVGANINPRTASQVSHSPSQNLVLQGARTPAFGALASASTTGPGPVAATDHNRGAHGVVAMAAGGPAINGTTTIRPGAGTGTIGGPPRAATGVLRGTDFRTRHP